MNLFLILIKQTGNGNFLTHKIDILEVGAFGNQNHIAIDRSINGFLDGVKILWYMPGSCLRHSDQKEQANNGS